MISNSIKKESIITTQTIQNTKITDLENESKLNIFEMKSIHNPEMYGTIQKDFCKNLKVVFPLYNEETKPIFDNLNVNDMRKIPAKCYNIKENNLSLCNTQKEIVVNDEIINLYPLNTETTTYLKEIINRLEKLIYCGFSDCCIEKEINSILAKLKNKLKSS